MPRIDDDSDSDSSESISIAMIIKLQVYLLTDQSDTLLRRLARRYPYAQQNYGHLVPGLPACRIIRYLVRQYHQWPCPNSGYGMIGFLSGIVCSPRGAYPCVKGEICSSSALFTRTQVWSIYINRRRRFVLTLSCFCFSCRLPGRSGKYGGNRTPLAYVAAHFFTFFQHYHIMWSHGNWFSARLYCIWIIPCLSSVEGRMQ